MANVVANVRDWKEFADKLEHASEKVAPEIQRALLAFGEHFKTEAQRRAAAAGSTSIPPGIHVVPLPHAVMIRAEGVLAVLWEKGNKGSDPESPTFSHPVFGDETVKVNQPKHPFMRPLIPKAEVELRLGMPLGVELALRKSGVEVEAGF